MDYVGGDANPSVGHSEHRRAVFGAHARRDPAPRRGVFERVADQICDDLLDAGRIGVNPDRRKLHGDLTARRAPRQAHDVHHRLDGGRQVQGDARERWRLPGREPAHLEQVVHQA
jgi:hypothetical protein